MPSKSTTANAFSDKFMARTVSAPDKGSAVREKVVHKAIDMLATHGLDALSFEQICGPLKMSRSHLTYYFRSKRDIVEACMTEVLYVAQGYSIRYLQKAFTADEQMEAMVDASFDWGRDNPHHLAVYLIFLQYVISEPARYKSFHDKNRQAGRERLQAIVGMKFGLRGERSNPAAAKKIAIHIQSLITGNLVEAFLTNAWKDVAEARRETKKLIGKILA